MSPTSEKDLAWRRKRLIDAGMRTWCGSRINDTTLPNSRRYILGDGSQSVRAESSPTDGGFARSALDDLEHPPVLYYLAAHKGANPLAALTEAYQSAYLACAVLPGSAWRWRPCSPADRGSQRTNCQSRIRPMPLPQETW